jgi:hypothetical protein
MKTDAILHMDRHHNAMELRMSPNPAHILKPLTDQSSLRKKAPIKWTDETQKAFKKMCLLMAADALAAYPDHNKRFDVYTDASEFQLGGCIIQEKRPVAHFSRKLKNLSKTIPPWKTKCFPSLQLSKNFEVCSSVQTFMFLWIIKPDVQYSQNAMHVTLAHKN